MKKLNFFKKEFDLGVNYKKKALKSLVFVRACAVVTVLAISLLVSSCNNDSDDGYTYEVIAYRSSSNSPTSKVSVQEVPEFYGSTSTIVIFDITCMEKDVQAYIDSVATGYKFVPKAITFLKGYYTSSSSSTSYLYLYISICRVVV